MSTDRAGKTIVITGTSRGIGHHLARCFLALGYRVVGISRSGTPLEHPALTQIRADVGDLAQIAAIRDRLSDPTICGLINNAGIHGPIGPFESNDLGKWVATFYVNLFGGAALSQACKPSLRRNKGFIIFLAGGGSAFPRPNFSAYGVSKTAVVRLSEVLARELHPDVLVYCVAPGPTRPQLLEEAIQGGEVVPEAEIVDPSFAERLCVFLANNRDPRYSGKFIHVKDRYQQWGDAELASGAYTLRRIKI